MSDKIEEPKWAPPRYNDVERVPTRRILMALPCRVKKDADYLILKDASVAGGEREWSSRDWR